MPWLSPPSQRCAASSRLAGDDHPADRLLEISERDHGTSETSCGKSAEFKNFGAGCGVVQPITLSVETAFQGHITLVGGTFQGHIALQQWDNQDCYSSVHQFSTIYFSNDLVR